MAGALKELAIAAAQPACSPYDVAANAEAHAEGVRRAAARVVVFPELSLTGYELDAAPLSPEDSRLDPLRDACGEMGSVALAGAPVEGRRGQVHIALLAIDGSGVRVAYRKQYLGGDETARFAPGEGPGVLEVDGWRLGLAICKDTGVPQHPADTAALGMDAYLAAVLEHAEDAGVPEERAVRIAREHGVWVAVASFAGSTGGGYGRAAGGSGIWGPDGTVLARAGSRAGEVTTAWIGQG